MRLRTKLFLTWAGMMPLLWVPAFWSVQRTVEAYFDQGAREAFDGAKQNLAEMREERVSRMEQAGRLVMNIPELRALIAEQNIEITADNLASLRERLDYLRGVVGARFVSVLNRQEKLIAQSAGAPWATAAAANAYVSGAGAPGALVHEVFGEAQAGKRPRAVPYGVWAWGGRFYQVVAIPLIFQSDDSSKPAPEGALLVGIELSDDVARQLGKSHNCQVTFLEGTMIVASSLSAGERPQLLAALPSPLPGGGQTFVLRTGGASFRGAIEPVVDAASGLAVGRVLIQAEMPDTQVKAEMLHSLLYILISGLVAAGAASYLISGAVTRPVRRLAAGVHGVAGGDLNFHLPVQSGDELGQLSASFNEMVKQLRSRRTLERQVEEAQASSRAKGQFLANMSHEIRTPLNGVIGMADLLLATQLSEPQRRYAGLVKTSGELLTNLINDILDFSKIEAGRLEIESIEFDLHPAVEEIIDLLSQRARRKGLVLAVYFDPRTPRAVRGDPDRLRQVLVNLINNAIKFTERGSVIVRVSPRSVEAGAAVVRFSVIDTGMGVAAEQLDRLFKPFSQVDASTTRRFGGTGLGLAISKQLAELMGGAIGVESESGVGSAFWFTAKLELGAARAARPAAPALRDVRVLVVDDSHVTRTVLEEQLASWKLPSGSAATTADAIGALRRAAQNSRPFTVAVIDSALGDGGLAPFIKSDAELSQTVLIALSAMESPLDGAALSKGGFAGQITKPVHQSQLFDTIMLAMSGGAPAAVVQASQPAAAGRGGRILLAEDTEVNQIVAVELLRSAGYEVTVVDNGRAAVEARFGGVFDLILMDCQMPEMDGFEATRAIRYREERDGAGRVAIVALTANAIKGDRELCLAAGMDGYCSKPIEPRQLLAAIETALVGKERAGGGTEIVAAETGAAKTDGAGKVQLPPIQVEELLKRCMNNRAVIDSVLGKFEKQAGATIAALQSALGARDAAAVARTAHSLKGAAGIVAAEGIARLAAEIEELGRKQSLGGLERPLAALAAEIAACLDYLPRVRQNLSEQDLSPQRSSTHANSDR